MPGGVFPQSSFPKIVADVNLERVFTRFVVKSRSKRRSKQSGLTTVADRHLPDAFAGSEPWYSPG
jgi:hypothetical protein